MDALNESSDEFATRFRLLGAVKLYKIGKLSLGKAAQLAGMDKIDFIGELGKCNVPIIKYPLKSLQDEVKLVKELADEK